MTLSFPYLISFLIGYFAINLIQGPHKILHRALHCSLAIGIGLGISALLTFISFLIFNQYHPTAIISLNIICLLSLIISNAFRFPQKNNPPSFLKSVITFFRPSHVIAWVIWGLLTYLIYFVAKIHPFGEWDAWALWNMKTKFLILSGHEWKALFSKLHWHTQPDYPLLLPFMNVWAYSIFGKNLQIVTSTTAIILSVSCGLLLFSGLKQFIKKEFAFLVSLILFINSYFIYLATAQYADILLAFYLLASIIVLPLMIREQHRGMALLWGVLLGLMTFTKNEGIVLALLFAGITTLFLLLKNAGERKLNTKLLLFALLGIAMTSCFTIFFKFYLAPPNRDILTNLVLTDMKFLNWSGLMIIVNAFFDEISHRRWSFTWIFLIFLMGIRIPKLFYKECSVISFFFIAYGLVLLLIYLTTVNFDLSWRLTNTLPRILFYLLPSILFFGFYVNGRKKMILI